MYVYIRSAKYKENDKNNHFVKNRFTYCNSFFLTNEFDAAFLFTSRMKNYIAAVHIVPWLEADAKISVIFACLHTLGRLHHRGVYSGVWGGGDK